MNSGVVLRPIVLSDASDRYVAWLNDYDVVKFTEQRFVEHTLESVRDFIANALEDRSVRVFAIVADERHVGNLKIGPIDFRHGSSQLSYFVGERSVWGRGVATSAIGQAVGVAAGDLGLRRLEAGVYDGNDASERALLRNGFALEGVRRARFAFEDRYVDCRLFGRLIHDAAA